MNYYEDYSFAAHSVKTKGLLTGKNVNILGSTRMLLIINPYDNEGRVVKSILSAPFGQ